jgi:DNA-binding response OmpR family regulator
MKILLIEPDVTLARDLASFLSTQTFHVEHIADGETGAEYGVLDIYDLLIISETTPGLNGLQLVRRIRSQHCGTPILMLMEQSHVEARIEILNAGADYCLQKPFDKLELLALINAQLRRQGSQVDNLVFGNTELELSTCMLRCGSKTVRLTAKEFDVMRQLFRTGEKLIPKDTLLARVWGFDTNAVDNHVEVYMAFLRKKLWSIDSNVQIHAVRRMGYHLRLRPEETT